MAASAKGSAAHLQSNCQREARAAQRKENRLRKEVEYDVDDVVIVSKQVQSKAKQGISAKLVMKAKGPYRVVGKAGANSYRLQKLPFCRGLGRPGTIIKENVKRMEKIPTTLVIHKRTDGVDSRLATMSSPFVTNPLEQQLGAVEPGRYKRAEGLDGENWAYVKIKDMWHQEVDSDSSDDDAGDLERQVSDEEEENTRGEDGSDDNDGDGGGIFNGDDNDGDDGDIAAIPRPQGKRPHSKEKGAEQKKRARFLPSGHTLPSPSEPARAIPGAETAVTAGTKRRAQPESRPKRSKRTRGMQQPTENAYERFYPKPRAAIRQEVEAPRASERQRVKRVEGGLLADLYRKIESSQDKVFIIKYQATGTTLPGWYVVQADLDETDPVNAKILGEYHCRFLTAHATDASLLTQRECRYWPELRETRRDGSLGRYVCVAPAKANGYVQRVPHTIWFGDQISLAENRMAGPFNLTSKERKGRTIRHCIPDEAWKEFEEVAPLRGVDSSTLNELKAAARSNA
jgi:hypothetical protein